MDDKNLGTRVKNTLINGDGSASITCTNMPEGLFDENNARKHFSKFGKVSKIILKPKKQMCVIEYENPVSAKKALLNAGAFDGFMFDVTRTKNKIRRRSKKDDDPEWLPDSDVEEELSAMSKTPVYRKARQKPMEVEAPRIHPRITKHVPKKEVKEKVTNASKPPSAVESPMVTTSTSLSTSEAAGELNQLRSRVALTPDDQWRLLDARDRILRSWGGAGARVSEGGATVGSCPDMCPEKERLHRQAEHQVMSLEADEDCDYRLVAHRAVKQYSRSSADQEMPMCYELRPTRTLRMTCDYLLHEIADTHSVSLADWFHFMWDRLRSVRKDITQQALCCAETISLVEMCARFHAHCSARLADLEHTQFDQKLNTDNLTKCLQTLKHMYGDVDADKKPMEAEFRGYIALLNLGDSNFWWEIKQLPSAIQKSKDITFAIEVFNAIDNNNYVKFFRLVKQKATYLQACILLRYFNDVRARALARIVKAYAPRGGSKFPANDLIKYLAFENIDNLRLFISHYGLRVGKTHNEEDEVSVILDRNQFIEDSDPYPISRSINLIESKRECTVGEILAGGQMPRKDYQNHKVCTSFNANGTLKESALLAEDQGYHTMNDTNKNVISLKSDLQRLVQGGSIKYDKPINVFKQEPKPQPVVTKPKSSQIPRPMTPREFSFSSALPVAPVEVVRGLSYSKQTFSFSKPEEAIQPSIDKSIFNDKSKSGSSLFSRVDKPNENKVPRKVLFSEDGIKNVFDKVNTDSAKHVFSKLSNDTAIKVFNDSEKPSTNLFTNSSEKSVFKRLGDQTNHVFSSNKTEGNVFLSNKNNVFSKSIENKPGNIFAQATEKTNLFSKAAANIPEQNIFSNSQLKESSVKGSSIFSQNANATQNGPQNTPSSLFNSAVNSTQSNKPYSIFKTKNNLPEVVPNSNENYNQIQGIQIQPNDDELALIQLKQEQERLLELQRREKERLQELERMERERRELERREMERQQEISREQERKFEEERKRQEEERKRQEEERKRQEEERKRQEELRKLEEKRREEQRRQEELRRRAEEVERMFKERVEKESTEVSEELITEVNADTVTGLLKEEMDSFEKLLNYANLVNEEIITDVCHSMCLNEIKAEILYTNKIMKKWFYIWKVKCRRNLKRRKLLEDTPIWLSEKPFEQEARCLKREDQQFLLNNMISIRKGYRFSAEFKPQPTPEPYRIVDIIRSPFLRRMRQINYPYDKCFFWKITLVSPGAMKWINKKVQIEPWILAAFSDKKKRDSSHGIIHIDKYSWNGLMDFAISVSLSNDENKNNCTEGLEGSHALLFYTSDDDNNLMYRIECTLRQKYLYQVLPVAIILPNNKEMHKTVNNILTASVNNKLISCFKIFMVDQKNTYESVNSLTKSALKWLAKKCPANPPLEVDFLKSLCQKYLANELWHRLRLERNSGISEMFKDLQRLVRFYNMVLSKLTNLLTNEDLYNHPMFPLEFKQYLDDSSPYPRPYEFISSSMSNSENAGAVRELMSQLRLPEPLSNFIPSDLTTMEEQIKDYCGMIGWFNDPEEVMCKVVALLPNRDTDDELSCERYNENFQNYDLLDLLNVVVYEKINKLENFNNRHAIYAVAGMREYRNSDWWYGSSLVKNLKHKAVDLGPSNVEYFIEAKRRKLSHKSMEYLEIQDSDTTLVETTIKQVEDNISHIELCSEAVQQLEQKVEEEKQKAIEFENMLLAALADV